MVLHKLFQNATLITFNSSLSSVQSLHNHDLLIKNDRIASIAQNIDPPQDAEIIDATGKIITPGFINTHTHSWESAYRSMAPDVTLSEYMTRFSPYAPTIQAFSADDLYVSTLEGYLEGLNGGTTSFVEHNHAAWAVDVVEKGYDAAVASGGRIWWCVAAENTANATKAETAAVMAKVRDHNEGRDALVRLGYAWDTIGTGNVVEDEKAMQEGKRFVQDLKVEAITLHHLGGPWAALRNDTIVRAAEQPANIQALNIPVIFSHAGFVTSEDIASLRKNDWHLSITPESEMHYGHGQKTSHHVLDQASLGIDTAWTFAGDMMTQARIFLQHVRANEYQKVLEAGKAPFSTPMKVEDAFLLLTRQGGLALRRPDLGVLEVGAKADVAVFDMGSPNMAGAFADPVAAVVLHANVGDVWGVLVDGEWRKKEGKLVVLAWEEFRKEFEAVARRVQDKAKKLLEGVDDKTGKGPFGGAMEWGEVETFSTTELKE